MSSRLLQFIPLSGTRVVRVRPHPELQNSPWGYMSDIESMRCWLEHNSPDNDDPKKINWRAASGLALSFLLSAGFWAGIVFAVERLLK